MTNEHKLKLWDEAAKATIKINIDLIADIAVQGGRGAVILLPIKGQPFSNVRFVASAELPSPLPSKEEGWMRDYDPAVEAIVMFFQPPRNYHSYRIQLPDADGRTAAKALRDKVNREFVRVAMKWTTDDNRGGAK